jgi:protein kinase-like protein
MGLSPGTRLGPYELIAAAGAGGMGEVYRARDTRLNRIVAIKILPTDVQQDADRRQRFLREAEAVAALTHPHICTLHDIGYDAGVDYLVMEIWTARRWRCDSNGARSRWIRRCGSPWKLPKRSTTHIGMRSFIAI